MSSLYGTKMTAYRDEGEVKADYQSFSALAAAGLAFGLMSPIAFFSMMAASVPIFAAILNLFALMRIAYTRPTPRGKSLALCGLFVSLFCAGGGILFNMQSESITKAQARYVADQWFEAARRGDYITLHQMSLLPDERDPESDRQHLQEIYGSVERKRTELANYVEIEPIPTLARLKDDVKIEFFRYAKETIDGSYERFQQVYLFTFEEDGVVKQGFVALVVKRWREHRHAESGWYVESYMPDYAGPKIPPPSKPTFKGRMSGAAQEKISNNDRKVPASSLTTTGSLALVEHRLRREQVADLTGFCLFRYGL